MSAINALMTRFNAGEVSKAALARVDVDRIRLTAETQINWMPRKLGSMTMRPGLEYLGSTKSNAEAVLLPFVSSITKKAVLEFTNQLMRIWVGDVVLTRPSVSTTVANGAFSTAEPAGTAWTRSGSGTFTSVISGGDLQLTASALGSEATASQQVTVAVGDRNVLHALRVTVTRGPVQFRVGSSAGGEDKIKETTLRTGVHSLAFTPAGDFHITFSTRQLKRTATVTACTVEASGAVEIPTPYTTAKLDLIRYAQSARDVHCLCEPTAAPHRAPQPELMVNRQICSGGWAVPAPTNRKVRLHAIRHDRQYHHHLGSQFLPAIPCRGDLPAVSDPGAATGHDHRGEQFLRSNSHYRRQECAEDEGDQAQAE